MFFEIDCLRFIPTTVDLFRMIASDRGWVGAATASTISGQFKFEWTAITENNLHVAFGGFFYENFPLLELQGRSAEAGCSNRGLFGVSTTVRVEFPFAGDYSGQCATVGGGLASADDDREEVAEPGHLFHAEVPSRCHRTAADSVAQEVSWVE